MDSIQAATRIYGVVTDASTHKGVPYTSVYMQHTTDGCHSDIEGNFVFFSPVTDGTLVVTSLGYVEQHIAISDTTQYPLHIQLVPITYEPRLLFGPINMSMSNNALEGLRLRVGGSTSSNYFPQLVGRYFIAYGFGDERFKYMGELEYTFKAQGEPSPYNPIHSLRLHYEDDSYQYGQTYLYTDKDNLFLYLKRIDDNLIGYLRKAEFAYHREHYRHISSTLTLRHMVFESSHLMPFDTWYDDGLYTVNVLPHSEFEIALSYVPREISLPGHMTSRPVISLSHRISAKGVLGSRYTYHHTESSVRMRFGHSSSGYIDAVAKAGCVWNNVPYPLLIVPNANLSYTLQPESFALIYPMEFIADTYASWEATYHPEKLLLARLPFIKQLRWREVIDFRGFYGHLRPSNIPTSSNGLYLFPYQCHAFTSLPYMELSFGIENIFKVLELHYVRRLTYLHVPEISEHGVRLRLHLQF